MNELKDFNMSVDVYDNWACKEEVQHEYKLTLIDELKENYYDAIVLAVDHSETKQLGVDALRALGKENHILYDVKHVLAVDEADIRL